MFTKLYTLTAISFISFSLHAMQPVSRRQVRISPELSQAIRELNQQDKFGNTPLHIAVMGPQQRNVFYPEFDALIPEKMRKKETYDLRQSSHAAVFIIFGARVNIKNNDGYTAWHFAESNRTYYPKIHAVIQAASVLQQCLPNHPLTKCTFDHANGIIKNHVADGLTLQTRNYESIACAADYIKQNNTQEAAHLAEAIYQSDLIETLERKISQ